MADRDDPSNEAWEKQMWGLSLASNSMGYLLLCGITLLIAALVFHVWSRLLWLICGACFGAFAGFRIGRNHSVRARYSDDSTDSTKDAEATASLGSGGQREQTTAEHAKERAKTEADSLRE